MRCFSLIVLLPLMVACTKKVGRVIQPGSQPPAAPVTTVQPCQYQAGSTVSYSQTISKIFSGNCMPCHATPGDGGINLDSYDGCKTLAKSGELLQVVTYDPGNIQMPPPPQKLLDSCQIKALTLWIEQGCLFN